MNNPDTPTPTERIDTRTLFRRFTNAHFKTSADEYREGASDASIARNYETSRLAENAFLERISEMEADLEECKHQNGISVREMTLEKELAAANAKSEAHRADVTKYASELQTLACVVMECYKLTPYRETTAPFPDILERAKEIMAERDELARRADLQAKSIAALSTENFEARDALTELVLAEDATIETFGAAQIDRLVKAMTAARVVLAPKGVTQ